MITGSGHPGGNRAKGTPGCIGYTARSGSDIISPPVECRSPVVVTLLAGCVHEHIAPRDLCSYHAEDARAGVMLCGNCLNADGHDCHLMVIQLWSEPDRPRSPSGEAEQDQGRRDDMQHRKS